MFLKILFEGKSSKIEITEDLTLESFVSTLSRECCGGLEVSMLQAFHGFPQTLLTGDGLEKCSDLGVKSGMAIIVRKGRPPTLQKSVEGRELTRTTWSCSTCTLINQNVNRCCEVCGAQRPLVGDSIRSRLTRKIIDADNSCLYNSFGYLLLKSLDKSMELREICRAACAADPETYSECMLGKHPVAYQDWVINPGCVIKRFYDSSHIFNFVLQSVVRS